MYARAARGDVARACRLRLRCARRATRHARCVTMPRERRLCHCRVYFAMLMRGKRATQDDDDARCHHYAVMQRERCGGARCHMLVSVSPARGAGCFSPPAGRLPAFFEAWQERKGKIEQRCRETADAYLSFDADRQDAPDAAPPVIRLRGCAALFSDFDMPLLRSPASFAACRAARHVLFFFFTIFFLWQLLRRGVTAATDTQSAPLPPYLHLFTRHYFIDLCCFHFS